MPAPGDNPRHSLQLAPLSSFPFTLHQLVFLKVRPATQHYVCWLASAHDNKASRDGQRGITLPVTAEL